MTFQEAFDVFTEELRRDEGLYVSYQANIAMAFYDTCRQAGYSFPALHELSNVAATHFLTLLLRKTPADIKEGEQLPPTPQGMPVCPTCKGKGFDVSINTGLLVECSTCNGSGKPAPVA